ncbi:MAG: hypothetical protein LBL39_02750 [Planctomycetaceae bacterium]|jgi:hypothetical protein|nr:hypothetical protein [Planctomycetaceae bacterium]
MKQLILISFVCLIAIGCGNTVRVDGKVKLEDGTPVTKGFINFNNGDYEARGVIGKDGTYRVETDANGKGLKRGDYKVYFSGTHDLDEKLNAVPIIDKKYDSANTTDLTISIDSGTEFNPVLKPSEKE